MRPEPCMLTTQDGFSVSKLHLKERRILNALKTIRIEIAFRCVDMINSGCTNAEAKAYVDKFKVLWDDFPEETKRVIEETDNGDMDDHS